MADEKKTLNPHLYVPMEFTETDGVLFTGKSWVELVMKVVEYRKRAKLPQGNPEREIVHQICQKHPNKCQSQGRQLLTPFSTDLHIRILEWTLRRKDSPAVPEKQARERARICGACPRQKPWERGCASCASKVARLRKERLPDKPVDFVKDLGGCSALAEDPKLSVWLRQPAVDDPSLPAHCWRRP